VAAFGGLKKFQNGGRCHGNQGIKWLPNTKIRMKSNAKDVCHTLLY
jgi:hypothetical protein